MSIPQDEQQQAQIIAEVGDPNSTIKVVVPAMWLLFADKAALDWKLRYQYVKRAALDVRLAEEQADSDFTVYQNVEDSQSQRFTHLQQMRVDCQAEIVRLEHLLHASRAPASGVLTTTEPEKPADATLPDANDPLYSGNVYVSRLEW